MAWRSFDPVAASSVGSVSGAMRSRGSTGGVSEAAAAAAAANDEAKKKSADEAAATAKVRSKAIDQKIMEGLRQPEPAPSPR